MIKYLNVITSVFELTGVIIIMAGTSHVAMHVVQLIRSGLSKSVFDVVRIELGRSIILSLEFFVAGDIIRTVIAPDYYELGMLAILVAIRTVMTFFLSIEIEQVEKKIHE